MLDHVLAQVGPAFEERAPQHDRDNTFVRDNLIELRDHGAYKSLIPTELGGHGVSYTELCYFIKDLAKRCPSTALTLSMHQHLVSVLLFKHLNGDEGSTATLSTVADKDFILVSTGGGDWLSSNGSAQKVDGGFKIDCVKPFCSGARLGNVAVMSCAYDDGAKEHVIHFSIPLSADGVEVMNDWDAMGMRGTGSHSIRFNDVFVPQEKVNLVRDRGVWHPVWDVVSTLAFPVFMAPYAGVAEAIAQKTVKLFSGRSNHTAGTIACLGRMQDSYQITRWAFDDMVAQVRNLDIKPDNRTAAKAHQSKSIIAKHGRESAQAAMEALGGYSYFRKVEVERLYRDLLAAEFHPLQTHKQEELLGEFLLKGNF